MIALVQHVPVAAVVAFSVFGVALIVVFVALRRGPAPRPRLDHVSELDLGRARRRRRAKRRAA